MSFQPTTPEQKKKQRDLVRYIENKFNQAELDDLFFELSIDVENISANMTGKKAKSRELVLYCARNTEKLGENNYRSMMYPLLEAINDLKPDPNVNIADYAWLEWPYPGSKTAAESSKPPQPPVTPPPIEKPTFSQSDSGGSQQTTASAGKEDYANFDIFIAAKQEDKYPVTARSKSGETEKAIRQKDPYLDEAFADVLYFMSELSGTESDTVEIGKTLRSFLFPPTIQGLFAAERARANAAGQKGVRVRLHIAGDAPEMTRIPWEYCRDDRSFLALDESSPIVRYTSVGTAVSSTNTPEKVRILLVTASPKDQPLIDLDAQIKRVKESLEKLVKAGRVELKVVEHATRRDLRSNFRRYDPHILHFLGHGMVKDGDGALLLEDNDGNTSTVDADDMYVLARSSSVRLVVLSACKTAAHDEENTSDAIMGMAPKLVAAGVPAVVAMQYEVPEDTAVAFVRDLYQFLADGDPLDAAMTEARIGVYFDNDDKLHWAIPVLFMRSPDGKIW